jgi:hypothetical protein
LTIGRLLTLPYRMFQVPGTPATVTLLIVALPAGWRPGGSRSHTIKYD